MAHFGNVARQKGEGNAFTLTELLVTISIIGLLAGLISVAVPKAMEAGKKTKAKAELISLVSAAKAYKQEYGRFPTTAGPGDDEHLYASYATKQDKFSTKPYGNSADLIAILCGENRNGMNPKGVRFLEPGKLIEKEGEKFILQDPWGQEYCMMFDSNEDGGVEYWGSGDWQRPNIMISVIAVSAGPNKRVDGSAVNSAQCDDILSWR